MTSGSNKDTQNSRSGKNAKRRFRFTAPAVALVLTGLVVLHSLRHVQLYKVTVLPSLSGRSTQPTAINDSGQIVGIAEGLKGRFHLFLWDPNNGMRDLGPVLRHPPDINNAGQIAATMTDPNGVMHAFIWDSENGRQMLGTLDGATSAASGLNNQSDVVGTLYPAWPKSRFVRRQAFIWDKSNGMRKLLPSERRESIASAINDAGQVIGSVGTYESPRQPVPCFWSSTEAAPGSAPPLLLHSMRPGASDLNNNGQVLVRTLRWGEEGIWGFLWDKETEIDGPNYLFRLEKSIGPLRFNDSKQVIYGEKHTSSLERISKKYFGPYTQRCLWDPKRGKIVLDKQVPRKMGKLLHVRDINNRGCIVGIIRSAGLGNELGVLLEPIPEPWGK